MLVELEQANNLGGISGLVVVWGVNGSALLVLVSSPAADGSSLGRSKPTFY